MSKSKERAMIAERKAREARLAEEARRRAEAARIAEITRIARAVAREVYREEFAHYTGNHQSSPDEGVHKKPITQPVNTNCQIVPQGFRQGYGGGYRNHKGTDNTARYGELAIMLEKVYSAPLNTIPQSAGEDWDEYAEDEWGDGCAGDRWDNEYPGTKHPGTRWGSTKNDWGDEYPGDEYAEDEWNNEQAIMLRDDKYYTRGTE